MDRQIVLMPKIRTSSKFEANSNDIFRIFAASVQP